MSRPLDKFHDSVNKGIKKARVDSGSKEYFIFLSAITQVFSSFHLMKKFFKRLQNELQNAKNVSMSFHVIFDRCTKDEIFVGTYSLLEI